MARRRRSVKTPEQIVAIAEQRRKNREEARSHSSGSSRREDPPAGVMKTYKVVGNRICHGKKKGDFVDLWDTGATRALVEAGHLVEAYEDEEQAED